MTSNQLRINTLKEHIKNLESGCFVSPYNTKEEAIELAKNELNKHLKIESDFIRNHIVICSIPSCIK